MIAIASPAPGELDDGLPDEALVLKPVQVARLLQVSRRTLNRMVSSQEIIPPIYVGRSPRWRRDLLTAWIGAGCPPLHGRENATRR